MSYMIYLTLNGKKQGLISAGCSTLDSIGNRYQKGHEDQIQVLSTPTVVCTNNLTTATLNVQKDGEMTGNFNHKGGSITSNGITLHEHRHGGVRSGGDLRLYTAFNFYCRP
ncbi:type VI secretion system tube protein TssD [Xenorhabdus bovienii]|uniref:type VI secretion system tube protein TssD n=1 Tax=Xenorhabdus bovienii TaxID=40576 RepID=UPI003DA43EEA